MSKPQHALIVVVFFAGYFAAQLLDQLFLPPSASISLLQAQRAYRSCMQRHPALRNENTTWSLGVQTALGDCYSFGAIPSVVHNKDEKKQIIWPMNQNYACTFVTLGIGQDVTAEQQIKKKLKNCQFHGADPIDEGNREKYESFGKFYQFAVGANNISASSVYVKGQYIDVKNMTARPFYSFLRNDVGEKVIDYLFIDIEYAEYDIFPLLQALRARKAGFVFCQVNLEIHGAKEHRHKMQFHDFIRRILSEGIYVMTFNEQLGSPYFHHRLFFYNQLAPECLSRFFHTE